MGVSQAAQEVALYAGRDERTLQEGLACEHATTKISATGKDTAVVVTRYTNEALPNLNAHTYMQEQAT